MQIYDCITYFDEDLLLNFRLNCLNKYVDKFVIVECLYTHRGVKKRFNLDLNKFEKFKDKIIYIRVNQKPLNLNHIKKSDDKNTLISKYILNGHIWDHFQRNKILEGIKDSRPDDIIMISDLDEIPNLKNINFLKIKKKYNNIFHVKDGGWHYTNLKSAKDIFKKLTNYVHFMEFELSKIKLQDIKKMIQKKWQFTIMKLIKDKINLPEILNFINLKRSTGQNI